MIKLKRVYDESSPRDGLRILVERLWPRGVTKAKAGIDLWLKELAPTTELRKWFNHEPAKWKEFRKRYRDELLQKGDLILLLQQRIKEGTVTFIFAAHNPEQNSAVVLQEFLTARK